jgi:hypothetical protein
MKGEMLVPFYSLTKVLGKKGFVQYDNRQYVARDQGIERHHDSHEVLELLGMD